MGDVEGIKQWRSKLGYFDTCFIIDGNWFWCGCDQIYGVGSFSWCCILVGILVWLYNLCMYLFS